MLWKDLKQQLNGPEIGGQMDGKISPKLVTIDLSSISTETAVAVAFKR